MFSFFPAPWLSESAPQFEAPCDLVPSFSASSLTLLLLPTVPQAHRFYLNFQAWHSLQSSALAISLSWNSSFLSFCVTCCFLSLGSYFQCHPLLGPFTQPSKAAIQSLSLPLPILILSNTYNHLVVFLCLFLTCLLSREELATGWAQ